MKAQTNQKDSMNNSEIALILKFVVWAISNQIDTYLALVYFDKKWDELESHQVNYLYEKIDLANRSFPAWYCNLDEGKQAKAVEVARTLYEV